MNFKKHSDLEGQHAFLSASNYHWINKDEEGLAQSYITQQARIRGTRLHELASDLIELGEKLPRNNKTLNMYVNDAIGYKMLSEKVLFYSFNCFGTTDTILFKDGVLRIHDLKTGVSKTSFMQLKIYAALFCLEYDVEVNDIEIKLRIYQNDSVMKEYPEPDEIMYIMSKIKNSDKIINKLKLEGINEY